VSSTPFPLFPRVIRTPVFSRANSGPAMLFNLVHEKRSISNLIEVMASSNH